MIAAVAAVSGVAVLSAAAAIGAAVARRQLVRVTVTGASMAPTLRDGQTVVAARRGHYGVGDVVVFDVRGLADAAPPYRVKRIAAVGGQPRPRWMTSGTSIVPSGTVAVDGDNASASQDSRQLGYVPIDAVLGRVLNMPARARYPGGGRVSSVARRTAGRYLRCP